MNEATAFPLDAMEWLTGEGMRLMTPEQRGAALSLLCHAWLSDPPCTLPDDDAALARLSELGPRWKKAGGAVRALFEPLPDAPGRIHNRRQFEAWLKLRARAAEEQAARAMKDEATRELSTKRSEAGAKGALKRWGHRRPQNGDAADHQDDIPYEGISDGMATPAGDRWQNGDLPLANGWQNPNLPLASTWQNANLPLANRWQNTDLPSADAETGGNAPGDDGKPMANGWQNGDLPLANAWQNPDLPSAKRITTTTTTTTTPESIKHIYTLPRVGGRGGSSKGNSCAESRPLWSERMYRFKADKIAEWIERLTDHKGRPLRPGDEDFDTKFEAKWQMRYDYWIEQREAHEAYYLGLRGAG